MGRSRSQPLGLNSHSQTALLAPHFLVVVSTPVSALVTLSMVISVTFTETTSIFVDGGLARFAELVLASHLLQ